MSRDFDSKFKIVRQQRGKFYIMRVCISMLINWHKYS
ncbi:hypothetical protein AAHE18_07G102100 [Arachis hypogaea]